jgi:serine/threonine-protein kinase HipA
LTTDGLTVISLGARPTFNTSLLCHIEDFNCITYEEARLSSATITIQVHDDARWHDACEVILHTPEKGYASGATLEYLHDYVENRVDAPLMEDGYVQKRSVSVAYPADRERRSLERWPSFLLDMLPQGDNRRVVSKHLAVDRDHPSTDFALLMACGGNPFGNLRIKEAAVDPGLDQAFSVSLADILTRSDPFLELYHHKASISSLAIQGEWPKIALTEAKDGQFYPDGTVPDNEALGYFVAKFALPGDRMRPPSLLDAEFAYAQIATHLNVSPPAEILQGESVLLARRFDRAFDAGYGNEGKIERHGLESLVSAAGISEFGHIGRHEVYIEAIGEGCSSPGIAVRDYLLRDICNLALGNPDNHGRNSALVKRARGGTALAPFFDFVPMRLSSRGIQRSTSWESMKKSGGDSSLDWNAVLEALSGFDYDADSLKGHMRSLVAKLADVSIIARTRGMSREQTDRAMSRLADVIASVESL